MSVVNTVNITRTVVKSRREMVDERNVRDPLLFIFYVDDEVVSYVGDHFMFSEIEGFVSYYDFTTFLTPHICELLSKKCNINMKDVNYESLVDDNKVYIVESYLDKFGREVRSGERTRGTVLLLRQLD